MDRANANPKYKNANNEEDRRLEFLRANLTHTDWIRYIRTYNRGFLPSWGGHTCFSIKHTPGGGHTNLRDAKKTLTHEPEPATDYYKTKSVERDMSPTPTKKASSREFITCDCGHRRETTDILDYEMVIVEFCDSCIKTQNRVAQILTKRIMKRDIPR
jgi:hypothetical protein